MDEKVKNNINEFTEHETVVKYIEQYFSPNFTVKSNLEKAQYYIGPMFPDLIFYHKQTEKPVVILEVKKNGNVAQCIQQWKTVPNIPATLYVIVPEAELVNAKAVAQIIGLPVRFGSYKIFDNNRVEVVYE